MWLAWQGLSKWCIEQLEYLNLVTYTLKGAAVNPRFCWLVVILGDHQDSILPKTTITYTTSVGLISNQLDSVSSSESSSPTDNEVDSSSRSNTSMPEMFGHMNIPRSAFLRWTPGNFLLMLVWGMYSVIIVGVAETFLPYIILFTLFFFLVILG